MTTLRLHLSDRPRWGRTNYRMIVVSDAVAEVDRTTHEAELRTMARIFADVKTTEEVTGMLDSIRGNPSFRGEGLTDIAAPSSKGSVSPRRIEVDVWPGT